MSTRLRIGQADRCFSQYGRSDALLVPDHRTLDQAAITSVLTMRLGAERLVAVQAHSAKGPRDSPAVGQRPRTTKQCAAAASVSRSKDARAVQSAAVTSWRWLPVLWALGSLRSTQVRRAVVLSCAA